MICNKCGMQVGENNLYCTNCGNKLDDFIIDIKLAKKKKNIKNQNYVNSYSNYIFNYGIPQA